MTLHCLSGSYAVVQLKAEEAIPNWASSAGVFCSITRTPQELSIVCDESLVPSGSLCESNRRLVKVDGPLDFSLTGILSGLLQPLAVAKISVFTISTFDTDYILIHKEKLAAAIAIWNNDGHQIIG